MLLHCIRHGITESNQVGRFNGLVDDPLTEPQRRALLDISFDASRYDAVFCSPLRRAVETAVCLGLERWTPEPRMAERNLGIFQGLTPDECHERYPDEFAIFRTFCGDFVIPNGESRDQNLARILAWLEDASSYDRVLAITHGGTIDFLYRLGTGLPIHGGSEIFSAGNATLSIFEVDWPDVRLIDYSIGLDA